MFWDGVEFSMEDRKEGVDVKLFERTNFNSEVSFQDGARSSDVDTE